MQHKPNYFMIIIGIIKTRLYTFNIDDNDKMNESFFFLTNEKLIKKEKYSSSKKKCT